MSRVEGWILASIPLAMTLFCVAYGCYVFSNASGAPYFIAGHVVAFLAAICLALFCVAGTIIRQLRGARPGPVNLVLPALGYVTATATFVWGLVLIGARPDMAHYVAGHVVCGLGLITACVATVATGATRSTLIPENSSSVSRERSARAFGPQVSLAMIAVPAACAVAGFTWAGVLLAGSGGGSAEHFIAGHVLIGLSLICASLVALVTSIVRQVANVYTSRERTIWPSTVLALALVNLVWGLILVIEASQAYWVTPGWIMIGLSLIQFSILSKVTLLAVVWRSTSSLTNRIARIPVWSALITLLVSAFLFQAAVSDPGVVIAARVLVGLGAISASIWPPGQ